MPILSAPRARRAHRHHHASQRLLRGLAAGLLVTFAACESETSPTDPNGNTDPPALNEVRTVGPLDASSVAALTYFSLTTGTVVTATDDWDLALRRYEVRLNGGVSGVKGVTGFALGNNVDVTDAEILALTVQGTLPAFDAVREAQIPTAESFEADRLVADNTAYLNLSGVPTANASAYWKVRTADGAYALMRVTAITMSPSFALTSVTIESRIETGGTLGPARSVAIPVAGAPVTVSVVGNAAVAANGCNWDVQITPQSFGISVNTACNVGTFPGPAAPAFADATRASDASSFGAFLSALSGPIPNSVTDAGAPFRYNLQNDNRLTPTFNTYLVKTGEYVFKLQVVNYYSAAGASGFPTLRYARIR